jgi:hypothetical protein
VTSPVLEELGFYALGGQPTSSRDLVTEVMDGEAMGFGTVFISERYDRKEAVTLSGRQARSAIASGSRPQRRTTTPATPWSPRATPARCRA